MLAIFCVRLALGLILFLPLLWNCLPHARFVRTQFLTALGLLAIATLSAWEGTAGWLRGQMIAATALALLGALAWTLEHAPAGRMIVVGFIAVLAVLLLQLEPGGAVTPNLIAGFAAINEWTSAAILGAAMTAMLVGHSYLIAPGLALTPLMRMLAVFFVTIGIRACVATAALAFWFYTAEGHTLTTEAQLWLPVRWSVGLVAPFVFGWMAFSAAKIRSTQSATGILYVAVVCTILGELVSMILMRQTGLPL
jgi:hypothetical protein